MDAGAFFCCSQKKILSAALPKSFSASVAERAVRAFAPQRACRKSEKCSVKDDARIRGGGLRRTILCVAQYGGRMHASFSEKLLFASFVTGAACFLSPASATTTDLVGPPGSGSFGAEVKVLPNGNIVVADPDLSFSGSGSAVHLYSPSGILISTTRGTSIDHIGSGGIRVVGNGNFAICSPNWRSGVNVVGAVTWVDGTLGLDADVSASNSLIGSSESDSVCDDGITVLENGNYVVWSAGAHGTDFSGAVTWCPGNGGCIGVVSEANSLVARNGIGHGQVVPLSDGDYAVASPSWRDDNLAALGAVTRCSGETGCTGTISTTNSLVGATDGDWIGRSAVTGFGYDAVVALANGGFVVRSMDWQDANGVPVGAVTFVPASGRIGQVGADNSLVGTSLRDFDDSTIAALADGRYVVNSPTWDRDGMIDAGASTPCSGTSGCIGTISSSNSLVGTSANDRIGYQPATVLTNGNYVIATHWHAAGGIWGSVIWCNGTTGCIGDPTLANSLVSPGNSAGSTGVTALANGDFVVATGDWNSAGFLAVGAVTWCDGTIGCAGEISASNSLIGALAEDRVGTDFAPIALSNGSYAFESNDWQLDGNVTGAVTWCDGRRPQAGIVSVENSFVGTHSDTSMGGPHLFPLANGGFVVWSKTRSTGDLQYAGAITLLRGNGVQTGTIDDTNSVIGNVAWQGPRLSFDYDAGRDTLVVGKPAENIVTLLRIDRLFSGNFD